MSGSSSSSHHDRAGIDSHGIGDREPQGCAVAALVKLLVDSGFQTSRIEAALVKPATPANSGKISDRYAATMPPRSGRRPRAA